MEQKCHYIDLHTHCQSKAEAEVVRLCSAMALEEIHPMEKEYFSIGIHPWQIKEDQLPKLWESVNSAINRSEIHALGEAGIDRAIDVPIQLQTEVFERHIKLAKKHDLPLIIHSVRSISEILGLRKKYPEGHWIIHGFRGNLHQLNQCVAHNIRLSFGAALMHDNSKLHEVFRSAPISFLFLETDTSGLSIKEIYRQAADLLEIQLVELCNLIAQNFNSVFSIDVYGT